MSKVILDSSAFLALIKQETGCEIVTEVLPHAIMSSVNVAEVTSALIRYNHAEHQIKKILSAITTVVAFDEEQAYLTGILAQHTTCLGLSLGDRACINLGVTTKYNVYTSDKIWLKINGLECNIICIR